MRKVVNRCSAVLLIVLCLLLRAGANVDITILPRNLSVREGEYATFTCEVPCSHTVLWYVGDSHNSFPLPYIDSVPELEYTRSFTPEEGCVSTDPGTYIDSLTLLATADLDRMAVQCSVSMISCDPGDASCGATMYSRFRTLRVESLVAPSPTPCPSTSSSSQTSSSSSSSSTPCPSPSPVLVTSIETSVSTTTRTVTTKETVTETSILQPSCSPFPDRSDAPSSLLLKGVGLTSAVAVAVVLVTVSVLIQL